MRSRSSTARHQGGPFSRHHRRLPLCQDSLVSSPRRLPRSRFLFSPPPGACLHARILSSVIPADPPSARFVSSEASEAPPEPGLSRRGHPETPPSLEFSRHEHPERPPYEGKWPFRQGYKRPPGGGQPDAGPVLPPPSIHCRRGVLTSVLPVLSILAPTSEAPETRTSQKPGW